MLAFVRRSILVLFLLWTVALTSRSSDGQESFGGFTDLIEDFESKLELSERTDKVSTELSFAPAIGDVEGRLESSGGEEGITTESDSPPSFPIERLAKVLGVLAKKTDLRAVASLQAVFEEVPRKPFEHRWWRAKSWRSYLAALVHEDFDVFEGVVEAGLTRDFIEAIEEQVLSAAGANNLSQIDYKYLVAAGLSEVVVRLYLDHDNSHAHPIDLVALLHATKSYQEESFVAAVMDVVEELEILQTRYPKDESVLARLGKGYFNFLPLCSSTETALLLVCADMRPDFEYFIMRLETQQLLAISRFLGRQFPSGDPVRMAYERLLRVEMRARSEEGTVRPFIMLS